MVPNDPGRTWSAWGTVVVAAVVVGAGVVVVVDSTVGATVVVDDVLGVALVSAVWSSWPQPASSSTSTSRMIRRRVATGEVSVVRRWTWRGKARPTVQERLAVIHQLPAGRQRAAGFDVKTRDLPAQANAKLGFLPELIGALHYVTSLVDPHIQRTGSASISSIDRTPDVQRGHADDLLETDRLSAQFDAASSEALRVSPLRDG
jgi:hypothetical protein